MPRTTLAHKASAAARRPSQSGAITDIEKRGVILLQLFGSLCFACAVAGAIIAQKLAAAAFAMVLFVLSSTLLAVFFALLAIGFDVMHGQRLRMLWPKSTLNSVPEEALSNQRQITEVCWYEFPLSGLAGWLGVTHSFIKVAAGSEAYVLEKNDGEPAEQSVDLRPWSDELKGRAKLRLELGEESIKKSANLTIRLSTLRDVMIALGDYDIAERNCHHAALEVVNSLTHQQRSMPLKLRIFCRLGWFIKRSRMIDLPYIGAPSKSTSSSDYDSSGTLTCPLMGSVSANRNLTSWAEPGREEQKAVDPSTWCVSPKQFDELMKEVEETFPPNSNPNAHEVNERIIKPSTQRTGVSWALQRNPHGRKGKYFVTHSWNYPIKLVAAALKQVFAVHGDGNVWICFLANPQTCKYDELNRLLGESVWQSPFAIALQRADALVVVREESSNLYERLWCVFERILAHYWEIPCIPIGTSPSSSIIDPQKMGVNATTSQPKDQVKIMRMMYASILPAVWLAGRPFSDFIHETCMDALVRDRKNHLKPSTPDLAPSGPADV